MDYTWHSRPSSISVAHGCLKISKLSPYTGGRDKGMTPSQHSVNGPDLWADVTLHKQPAFSMNKVDTVTFFLFCSLHLTPFLLNSTDMRAVDFSRWRRMRSSSSNFWPLNAQLIIESQDKEQNEWQKGAGLHYKADCMEHKMLRASLLRESDGEPRCKEL